MDAITLIREELTQRQREADTVHGAIEQLRSLLAKLEPAAETPAEGENDPPATV